MGATPRVAGVAGPEVLANEQARILHDAIIMAAEQVGLDGEGKDGLVGYFKWMATKYPKLFLALLGQVLSLEADQATEAPSDLPCLPRVIVRPQVNCSEMSSSDDQPGLQVYPRAGSLPETYFRSKPTAAKALGEAPSREREGDRRIGATCGHRIAFEGSTSFARLGATARDFLLRVLGSSQCTYY
jgi:hypothetical protein